MPRQRWSLNSRGWQHGSWKHWRSSPSYTQEEWDEWRADQDAKQSVQALQTSLRQCRGSQALPPDDITALENRIEALKTAHVDALPLKERAARVEQQRRSYAGIEKRQIERITALEEQLAAEKLHLQQTKLNIQQAQAEADRIALLLAAQTAADDHWGDSDDLLAGENMDEGQESPDAEPLLEKFREFLHEMMTRIPPEQATNAFRTVSRRISRKTSTQDLLNSGPPDKQRRVREPATTQHRLRRASCASRVGGIV